MRKRDKLVATANAALKGALWSGIGQWGAAVISLFAFIINARILGPEVIGTNVLALSLVALGNMIVSGVLVEALIQRKNLTDDERSAGFWISMPFGILGPILFFFAAGFIPGDVGEILPWCALAMPIIACSAAPVAILMRELRFRALSTVELIAIVLSSTVGVSMAMNGYGVYSLVVMELVRLSARCIGVYVVSSYRPGPIPGLGVLKSVALFGGGGLLLSLTGLIQRETPRIAIGYWLGEEALGIFALAMRLFQVLSSSVLGPLGSVAMSVTGRLQDDHETLRELYLQSIRFVSMVAIPCFFGLAAVAQLLIPLAIGDSWRAAIVPAQILLFVGVRFAMTSNYVAILRGTGETRSPLIVQLVAAAIVVVGTPIAVSSGVVAVVLVLALRSLVTWPIGAHFLKQKIGIGLADQFRAGLGAAIGATLMAIIVSLWIHYTHAYLDTWVCLISAIAIGVIIYTIALFGFERRLVFSLFSRVSTHVRRVQQ